MPSTPTLPSLIPALKGDKGLYPSATWDAGAVPYRKDTWLKHNNALWLALRKTSVEPSDAAPDDWFKEIDLQDVADSTEAAAESAALARAWASQPVGEAVEGAGDPNARSALHQAARSEAGAALSEAWAGQPVGEDVAGAASGSRSALHWATTAAGAVTAGLTSISDAVSGGLTAIGSALSDALSAIGSALTGATDTINMAGSTEVGNVNTAGTNQTNAVNAAAAAQLNSILQAIGAKFYASTADALSKGLASITLGSGGSGATVAGQFSVGTTNGGGTQGLFLVNVAGGTITSIIKILNPGRGYTSAPTSFDTSAIAGLTGATFAATIGQNRNVGEYFATPGAASPALFDFYVVATATTATLLGSGPDFASVQELRNSKGTRNLILDPFFIETDLALGFRSRRDESYISLNLSTWDPIQAVSFSPYPNGKCLATPIASTTTFIDLRLDLMGVAEGAVIQFALEAASRVATYTDSNYMNATFLDRNGSPTGSAVAIMTATAVNPLSNTKFNLFMSPQVTVPTGAFWVRLQRARPKVDGYFIASLQAAFTNTLSKAVQDLSVPGLAGRIADLERDDPVAPLNRVLMRKTSYDSIAVATMVGITGTGWTSVGGLQVSPNSGHGGSYLKAACPVGGFNGIAVNWTWTADANKGASRILAVVRTCAAPNNPLNRGRLVAYGWIDCDPTVGNSSTDPILFLDPATGAPKTITSADLDDVWGVGYMGQNKTANAGLGSMGMFIQQGQFDNVDPNNNGAQFPSIQGFASGFSNIGGVNVMYPRLVLMTNPVAAANIPSSSFSAAVGTNLDEPPVFLTPSRKIFCTVGREYSLYVDALMQRNYRSTNFRVPPTLVWPTSSGQQEERIKFVPTSAGTVYATLEAYRGDILSSSCTLQFVTVANSAAAGTKPVLLIGDSMIANLGLINALKVIESGQAITSIQYTGTQGPTGSKNEGYSGKSLGAFRGSASLDGVNPNPFYDSALGDFSFAYYRSHAGAGDPDPIYVGIEAGGVDVGNYTSDAAAQAAAQTWATNAEFIIASIQAAVPGCKVGIHTIAPGPWPETDYAALYGGATWRQRRNWKILQAKAHTQFGGREGSGIYVAACGSSVDPETGWFKNMQPRSAAISRDAVTYANYNTMTADITKAENAIAFLATGSLWYIKVGPVNSGYWRSPLVSDGFVLRLVVDGIHTANGEIQKAEAVWGLWKNIL